MKKLSVLFIIMIVSCTVAMAQPRAIGGRVGYSIGPSYQHSIGEKYMLQADIDILGYWRGAQGTLTFNWVGPIASWNVGNMNWFAGVGVGGGYLWGWGRTIIMYADYYYPKNHFWNYGRAGFVGVAGMGGVEMNFKFGLQLSLDWRPLIGPQIYKGGSVDYFLEGLYMGAVGLGVRYKFK